MEKFQIIPFEFAHLVALQPREFEARELAQLNDWEERTREYQAKGSAYTGIIGDQIMGCAGIFLLWPGMAEVWAVTTPLVTTHTMAFHRTISRGLDVVERTMRLHRIQVAIHVDHFVSQKWIRRLGFKAEGSMPGYGPDGATYMRFARHA
jgi:RimJ/RimL family protein N-acetyltransferase